MKSPRNVTLELLRHGPPHNQLLSPLTRYLALCGNHSSVTVHVPYEHNQFLARHKALDYQGGSGEEARKFRELQLQITADEMSKILADVPGLISELAEPCKDGAFTHFELVLSASELALLPFELANAPNGFPGAGQHLALQSQAPLCITRRVRRVDNEQFRWPRRPRILFAAALPRRHEGLVQKHVTALFAALSPWVSPSRASGPSKEQPSKRLAEHLTVLPRASAGDISRALSSCKYTHIHILAHGVELQHGEDKRFGLALYDEGHRDTTDKVRSTRLATMIRSFKDDGSDTLSLPTVVTVASCHGAGQGSIVGAGSSVAHALHEAGVPLVVSSQFPLSFLGSIRMTEVLYQGLLWGNDPRVLLNNLRRQLKLHLPDTHDWASLVAYAAFPTDLDSQLSRVRIEQAVRSIHVAFDFSDRMAEEEGPDEDARRELSQLIEVAKCRLESIARELERDQHPLRTSSDTRLELATVYGRLASTEKRVAEMHFREKMMASTAAERADADAEDWKATLKKSQSYYRKVFERDRSCSWALVQDVAISVVLKDPLEPLKENWQLARLMSKHSLTDEAPFERSWSLTNLIELSLISLMFPENGKPPTAKQMRDKYKEVKRESLAWAEQLRTIVGKDNWAIVSHRRQLNRYVNWFYGECEEYRAIEDYKEFPSDVPKLIKGLAQQLLKTLPEQTPEDVMRG